MARHAEVTEEEIIEAGQEIEQAGKPVNPGSIRKKLGGRGGYPRIRLVWEAHKNSSLFEDGNENEISLPVEIEDNLELIIKQATKQLTQITKSSYSIAQHLAEKRVSSTIEEYKNKILDFEQFEQDASESIEQCENEIVEVKALNKAQIQEIDNLKAINIKATTELEYAKAQIAKLEIKEKEFEQLKNEYAKLQGRYEVLSIDK